MHAALKYLGALGSCAALAVTIAFAADTAAKTAQDKYTLKVPGGLAFSEFKGYEGWETIALSHSDKLVAVILGNPGDDQRLQGRHSRQRQAGPRRRQDGEDPLDPEKERAAPGQPTVPGTLHDVDFMVKDSKRFADSGGWGYAVFNYDAASETFTPGTMADQPPQANDAKCGFACHTIVKTQRLRFHGVRQAVSGAGPGFRTSETPRRVDYGGGHPGVERKAAPEALPMTLLVALVSTSQRVGATSARLAKVRELADALRALDPGEIEIAVQYLSGETPQGKFGLSYATLHAASDVPPAADPTLTILETDRRLGEIAVIRGSGSAARRTTALRELFALATDSEQEFLVRLLVGELRQGALAGVMIDAIAAAANLPVGVVRRAAMYAKNLGAVARVCDARGR